MSVDMSFADPISTLSPWHRLRFQIVGEREIANAALRQELAAAPTPRRTIARIRDDIRRYSAWLDLPDVRASKHWTDDVKARLAAAERELANHPSYANGATR